MLREPIIQFLLGGLILATVLLLARRPAEPPPWPEAVVREQAGTLAATLGRPLAESDLPRLRELLSSEELLFREALARGLHLEDPVIRKRLGGKVALLLTSDIPEPDEEELRTFHREHPDLFRPPPTLSFHHVFFAAGTTPAPDTVERLRDGQNPGSLGQPFPHGRQWAKRSSSEVRQIFGPSFLTLLLETPERTWQGPIASPLGQHFVYLLETTPASPRTFDDSRELARRLLLEERRQATLQESLDVLAEDYPLPDLEALPTP